MKKLILYCGLFLLVGCAKIDDCLPPSVFVKKITVVRNTDNSTRAFYNELSRALEWRDEDGYFFYTYGPSSLSSITTDKLTAPDPIEVEIPVTYSSGDTTVVIGTAGTSIGAVSGKTKTEVTFTKGIPAIQDGKVESSYVNIGTVNLQTKDNGTLKSCQAYISFSLLDLTVGGVKTKFFTVEGLNNEDIAGNVTYTISDCKGEVVSGASKKIVVNVSAEKQTDYYVALPAKTYDKGLRIILYDAGTVDATTGAITGGHINGWTDTKPGIVVTVGQVLALNDLTAHKTVPSLSLTVHPSDAHIIKLSDYTQTKKLWIEYKPSDMTDIDFDYSAGGIISAERGPDEDYDDGTGKKRYMTVNVKPICAAITTATTEKVCTLTVKDKYPAPGTTPVSTKCIFTVGMFVDLGLPSKTLWAASNLVGSSGSGLGFSSNVFSTGDYYQWGWTSKVNLSAKTTYMDEATWTGNPNWASSKPTYSKSGRWINMTGGYIYAKNKLNDSDDLCHVLNNSFRMPEEEDVNELRNGCKMDYGYIKSSKVYYEFNSKTPFYDDLFLYIPCCGYITEYKTVADENLTPCVWLRNKYTAAYSEQCCYYKDGTGKTQLWWIRNNGGNESIMARVLSTNAELGIRYFWAGGSMRAVKSK